MLLNARTMRAQLRMPSDRDFPVFTCDDARRIKAPMFLVKGAFIEHLKRRHHRDHADEREQQSCRDRHERMGR